MEKENDKNNDGNSNSNKVSNQPDHSSLLDAANLFGAYWPRDAAANLFAVAAGGFGLPTHPSLPFGMMSASSAGSRPSALPSSYQSTVNASAAASVYTNTLSAVANQAASLGIPAGSAAWWSMASQLAAQDYLARLQASGLNFAGLGGPADLHYSSMGLQSLAGQMKTPKSSYKGGHPLSSSTPLSRSQDHSKMSLPSKLDLNSISDPMKASLANLHSSSQSSRSGVKTSSSLTIQPTSKSIDKHSKPKSSNNDPTSYNKGQKSMLSSNESPNVKESSSSSPNMFASPFSINSSISSENSEGGQDTSGYLPPGVLGDPNSILGGVRLPPDTEIIKYTSSIVGPKVPGTTNRGRKKTISLDPPFVSLHPSQLGPEGLMQAMIKKSSSNGQDITPPSTPPTDKAEEKRATNGNISDITASYDGTEPTGETPLNLSVKPTMENTSVNSLASLSNISSSVGSDRISRRKPGPKPRRIISSGNQMSSSSSNFYSHLFSPVDSPRPPSRNEGSDGGSSTSSTCTTSATISTSGTPISPGLSYSQKEGRPRNLGRGISKPKKNTVASLLAQSRALGIKPVPLLDANASINQQMSVLKSNLMAAQQYLSDTGDEQALNRLLQDKIKGALSDSSTIDASDSDNLTDSNHTDSEMEVEVVAKKQKQYDERLLRVPLEKGWKRETIIRGLTKNGNLKGDVTYTAPDSSNKFKQMSDISQYLEYQKCLELSKENFTFSCRIILGDYLQPVPTEIQLEGNECIRLTEEDMNRRLEEFSFSMRTSIPVEQRIELARKQQAAREAARQDKEQTKLAHAQENEYFERQEQIKFEKEIKHPPMIEDKELKKQQATLLKEQERERKRQHMILIKTLESRRKLEARERKKQQLLAEKQANKEKKLEQRKQELEILSEIRKPCEDLEIDQTFLPEYERIPGLKLSAKAFGDLLMVFEFLHNFGETLGFDMESLPTLNSLQHALLPSKMSTEYEDELFSIMTHLLVCAIEDPGIPNPARYTTNLGQSLRQADITPSNISEILRIYLYANATGEIKALTGIHFEREREKRIADHHQNEDEMIITQTGKNAQYYELLHGNQTYKLSDLLKNRPFMSLCPTTKAEILAYICNELLQNKAVIRQIENSLETVIQQKKEKWLLDMKIRKLTLLHNKKIRTESIEKSHLRFDEEPLADSPSLNKDDLLDEEDNELSDNESVGTQPEEEEDNKLSPEELGKKLEKFIKTSEIHFSTLKAASLQLRAICFGQDRYYRRYWSLPKAGGIFVEATESADPDKAKEQVCPDNSELGSDGVQGLSDFDNLSQKEEEDDMGIDEEINRIMAGSEDDNDSKLAKEGEEDDRQKLNRIFENGDVNIKTEPNVKDIHKNADEIGENAEKTTNSDIETTESNEEFNNTTEEYDNFSNKPFSLFERLGQCVERENKTEEDLKMEVKAEVKEELKNEILNELKADIKHEYSIESNHENDEEHEQKWFSILSSDTTTCDEINLSSGARWENGIGACTKDIMELKIPVFPPPNSDASAYTNCDSPTPLQLTPEESFQLEYIRKHGTIKCTQKKSIPSKMRYGWWRIFDATQLREILDNLQIRGIRERELKRNFINIMQAMYDKKGRLVIEEGNRDLTTLNEEPVDGIKYIEESAPEPEHFNAYSIEMEQRIDMFLLEQIETLEDKVANASMQTKGWKLPNRDLDEPTHDEFIVLAKERLASLEMNIERRYLKPPLGVSTGDPHLATLSQESSSSTLSTQLNCDEIPKGLATWRDAVNRSLTTAQLSMCLYSLEACIAWDKSIMKANCQFCQSGDNEDKLLLCDGCDKGYHTYCFKPKMDTIPDGDWYCTECLNKATGDRNCLVCSKKISTTGSKLVLCELCPRAYHTDCIQPNLPKIPRGKYYCLNCISKKPQKKPVKKPPKPKELEVTEPVQAPVSPTPSHSSMTTTEDISVLNSSQSDTSSTNVLNVESPSTPNHNKKDRNKKLAKEFAPCKTLLEDLECHDDAWPFLLPVNTKQFPTYKKIIKVPMDLSTIKKRLQDQQYKTREDFCVDVRQIFNNCETFNEDDSPVGKAGHAMRQFFEARWNELTLNS
ncbi:bromodomain adjacent to zinc finger domain protein 2B isoform X1 [Diabrotica undecimpunctata]|uniref:bromodomain adjacent to zinc finger domain protein 2B isoform X1 n=1 Tax=Diabrotica undecimpunctata TaxID=50387 RepID=UPI003B6390FE